MYSYCMYHKKAVCSGYGDLSWNLLRYVSTNPIPHVQCQNKEKHLYMRDRMTNFWVTKSAPQKFFSDNFLSSFKSIGLRAAFQPFTKVVLKKFVAAAATKGALDSSSKRDKGFVIVCVTFTHTHNMSRRIRRYNVKEVWTYFSWQNIYKQGLSSAGKLREA